MKCFFFSSFSSFANGIVCFMHSLLRLTVLFAFMFSSVNTHLHSFVVSCVCMYIMQRCAVHILYSCLTCLSHMSVLHSGFFFFNTLAGACVIVRVCFVSFCICLDLHAPLCTDTF